MNEQKPKPQEAPWPIALVDADRSTQLIVQTALDIEPGGWRLECHLCTRTALQRIPLNPPQVVLMDTFLQDGPSFGCMLRLKHLQPHLRIVVFSSRKTHDDIILSLMAGASGFLTRTTAPSLLLDALKAAVQGRPVFGVEAQEAILNAFWRVGRQVCAQQLTNNERQILLFLIRGLSDKEIADRLGISGSTVHTHLVNLFHKLGVHRRADAVKKCLGVRAIV